MSNKQPFNNSNNKHSCNDCCDFQKPSAQGGDSSNFNKNVGGIDGFREKMTSEVILNG